MIKAPAVKGKFCFTFAIFTSCQGGAGKEIF